MTDADSTNQTIRRVSPTLFSFLSDLGLRAVYPQDIPFQAAQAKGKELNATIGQITDGHGNAMTLPSMSSTLSGMSPAEANRAFLYSPIQGVEELRQGWRGWQRRGRDAAQASTVPLVTVGLAHGISLAADLFSAPSRAVAVAAPFWGNYRQIFSTRTGARLLTAAAVVDGRYNCDAIAQALQDLPQGEPAIAILNLPWNPGGYMPTVAERQALRESLVAVAQMRPLMVICDDAYAGLVYEDEVPRESMFWDLNGAHERLVPVKVDGITKELAFFGGRVGFLTFPFPPDSEIALALESKVKCLVRATVGSPVAISQVIALHGLRDGSIEDEVERIRVVLEGRYHRLKQVFAAMTSRYLTPLPFNSGCFALVELSTELGQSSEQIRHRLLDDYDTGLVSIAPNFLRIAFCSMESEALPELVHRLQLAVDSG